ncbi:S1 family peptidase [Micromonospora aurantiaca (nom. illeg.)]|uniref:S1 family peptidase n=1 Tax=Micromonospora aurantiaca (nom. illeg.) TaxID=47850 RepID=UPI001805DFF2
MLNWATEHQVQDKEGQERLNQNGARDLSSANSASMLDGAMPSRGDARSVSQVVLALARIEPSGLKVLGTAFAVGRNLLATALHVVNGSDANLVAIAPRYESLNDYQDTSDIRVRTIPARITEADPFRDLALLEISEGFFNACFTLASSDDVEPGDPVITFGFPHADDNRLVLTQQLCTVGARVLIKNGAVKNKYIVLNAQARPGQSGGPAISQKNGCVVAITTGSYAHGGGGQIDFVGVDPSTLHQTTHAVSAGYLKGMLP